MITQEQELAYFIPIWQQKPPEYKAQTIEEVASCRQESNHTPDFYFYDFDDDGDLCSPTLNQKIRDQVRRENYTGQIEGDVVDILDKNIKQGHSRFAWISPPYDGIYPDLKIIVSEVVEHQGKRRFLNRAFLFNFDLCQSWDFAQQMLQISILKPQINYLEDIRKYPLILDPDVDWLAHLARVVCDPAIEFFVKTGEDQISKQQALVDASNFYERIINQPSVEVSPKDYGFGEYTSSCPSPESFTANWPNWCEYDLLTSEYKCKFCKKGLSLSQIKKHRCVC